jgi:L-ribulose-5-phosphate 3-epimerase/hexulose-6-phosphate isomerase
LKKYTIGLYEKAMPKSLNWRQMLECAKECGYDFVEISIDETDFRLSRLEWSKEERLELVNTMKEIGVPIRTMCLSGHRKYPFGASDPAVRARGMEIMEKAIVLSVKLGIRCIQLATYDVYYEESDEETKALFLEGMREAVGMAARAGVTLAMEIMDTQFVGTIVRAMHYIKAIPSPYFKIYPDLGNLSNFSKDPEAELELGFPEIVAIHVKETKPGIFKEVPFGTGQVRFVDIFTKLKELDYRGLLLVEMWADNSKTYTIEEAAAEIAEAKAFVMDKMQKAGWR